MRICRQPPSIVLGAGRDGVAPVLQQLAQVDARAGVDVAAEQVDDPAEVDLERQRGSGVVWHGSLPSAATGPASGVHAGWIGLRTGGPRPVRLQPDQPSERRETDAGRSPGGRRGDAAPQGLWSEVDADRSSGGVAKTRPRLLALTPLLESIRHRFGPLLPPPHLARNPFTSAHRRNHRRPPRDSLSRRQRLVYILVLGALTALGPFTIDLYLPAFPVLERSSTCRPR